MPRVVGKRYQITIDQNVREQLRIQPGDQAVEWVDGGRLVVAFLPRAEDRSMLGILKRYVGEPIEPIEDWGHLKERAWVARSSEVMRALETNSRRTSPSDRPIRKTR